MTYIVALIRNGTAALIADGRETVGANGKNEAMKIATVFPGCIIAVSGDSRGLEEFIYKFRCQVDKQATTSETWAHFREYCEDQLPTPYKFEAVLSERISGEPRLHLVDSTAGLIACGNTVTIGSGKDYLDARLLPWIESSLPKVAADLADEYGSHGLLPAAVALWLIQESHGQYGYELQEAGVGGAFYFMTQTSESESFQPTCAYTIARRQDDGNVGLDC